MKFLKLLKGADVSILPKSEKNNSIIILNEQQSISFFGIFSYLNLNEYQF